MTFRFCILVAFGFALASGGLTRCVSAGQDPATAAKQAVERYTHALELPDRGEQIKEFQQAQQLFRQVLESHAANGRQASVELWVAFGNASLQSEQVGWAVLGFRHALLIDSANTQAKQNLQFSRSLVAGWSKPEPASDFGGTLFFWKNRYSLSSQLAFSAVVFFLSALILSVGILARKKWLVWLAAFPFALWIVVSIPVATSLAGKEAETGVVVADEATLRTANSASAPVRLEAGVPAGAELKLLSTREDWVEVGFQGGSGWLMSHEFRSIARPFASIDEADAAGG